MDQSKKRKYMFIAGPLVIFITLIGLTYAFFNYTRTGQANTLGTGRIFFNSSQGEALTLTNIFPMTSTEASNADLDSVTVGITGDTTYTDGEEFVITIVDVENTVNNKEIPMNYIATYTAATGGTIGTSSNDYYNARNSKDATIYKLNATGNVEEDSQVLVGYIDNGATGISGTLTIKAYIDADRIAISDTYYENVTATPTPTAPNDQYGTTDEWVAGRTVLTTSEWNSLSSNPISFKIRAESNEGIWVEEPEDGTIDSCPGCKFTYIVSGLWTTWNTNSKTPSVITTGLYDSYLDVVNEFENNYFLGVILNDQNQVTNAYACGIYNGTTPFCVEGTSNGANYSSNKAFINGSSLWDNTCTVTGNPEYIECGPWDRSGALSVYHSSSGFTETGIAHGDSCGVDDIGGFGCYANPQI